MLDPRSLRIVLAGALAASVAGCAAAAQEDDLDDAEHWNRAYEQPLSECSGITPPDDGPFLKRVALTFDDGPNLQTTPKVLEILAKHGIKATFFINGKNAQSAAAKALLKKMVAAGHIVGNHTQNHADAVDQTAAEFKQGVIKTGNVLKGIPVTPKYFRFPFGSADCQKKEIVENLGYHVVGWHVDSADWCFASGGGFCSEDTFKWVPDSFRDDMVGYTMSQIKKHKGGIVLFHDVKPYTVSKLEPIIEKLESAGYRFVRVKNKDLFPEMNAPL